MFSTSFLAARVGAIVCCTVVTVVPFVAPWLAVVEEGMEPVMTDEVIALAAVFAVGTDGCSDVTCEEDVDTVFGTEVNVDTEVLSSALLCGISVCPRVQTQSAARRRQAILRRFMLGGGIVGSALSHSWAGSALSL